MTMIAYLVTESSIRFTCKCCDTPFDKGELALVLKNDVDQYAYVCSACLERGIDIREYNHGFDITIED